MYKDSVFIIYSLLEQNDAVFTKEENTMKSETRNSI